MRGLNPDHLLAFTEVVGQASFTRAAKRLNLAQPTVSLQIRDLETRLGVRLIAAMRRHRDGWLGQVRIGASTTALIYHLPPVLTDLRRPYPNIELVVTTGTTTGVIERILRNEIDLGIVSRPVTERLLETMPLFKEPLVAIFSKRVTDLPARVTPQYLLQQPLLLEFARAQVRALIIDWLSQGSPDPRPAMELDNIEAVKRMVASGLGSSIVPEAAVSEADRRAGIVTRPLKPALSRTLALIQRRDKPGDAALLHVREALLTLAR